MLRPRARATLMHAHISRTWSTSVKLILHTSTVPRSHPRPFKFRHLTSYYASILETPVVWKTYRFFTIFLLLNFCYLNSATTGYTLYIIILQQWGVRMWRCSYAPSRPLASPGIKWRCYKGWSLQKNKWTKTYSKDVLSLRAVLGSDSDENDDAPPPSNYSNSPEVYWP